MKHDKDKPVFSIIIPTYNTGIVLGQCLESLCNQSVDMHCFEVIVVNDGGEDAMSGSLDYLRKGLTLTCLYQEHKGPAAARNLGISHAKGDIILFLDDDSLPPKDWLKTVINAWDEFSDFDGIGGYTISEPEDSIYCRVNSDLFNWYLRQCSSEDGSTFLSTCNAGYKRTILNKVGKFDERFKKASGEDRDLNIKILRTGGRLVLDERILVYHDRDLSFWSFARKHYNYGRAAHDLYEKYPELRRFSTHNYIDFYLSILKRYSTFTQKLMAFLLLSLSQAATLIAYQKAVLDGQGQGRV